MPRFQESHIHRDYIVECERTLFIIINTINDLIKSVARPISALIRPEYLINLNIQDDPLRIIFYPGFGRWNEDIFSFVNKVEFLGKLLMPSVRTKKVFR